ncbi:hypothetical protein [Paenibacillus contaminans]|uniref:Phage capsid protein n=1 Tax=Paenibacillus contaminans TaxID=450362 RepID=A0A329MSY6_9BACL|nr:hypothetical protein [Paenibacillus contaminans]RAV22672.1 hypothetical protein DQG23_00175 [Paenibacillus contaminans]
MDKFLTYTKALEVTEKPLEAKVVKLGIGMDPLANIFPYLDVDSDTYTHLVKIGVGKTGTRKINGALNSSEGASHEKRRVDLRIYQDSRNIDRKLVQYYGNLLEQGMFWDQFDDLATSFQINRINDLFNASIANGEEFNGFFALAQEAGMVQNFDNTATKITSDNIYDILSALQVNTDGSEENGVFLMRRDTLSVVQKALRESSQEMIIATDDFGKQYKTFNGSKLIGVTGSTVELPDGSKQRIDYMPTFTFNGEVGTHSIIYMTIGRNNVHGLKGSKDPIVLLRNLNNIDAGEHPKIELEDMRGVVDKNGSSISVFEGLKLK